MERDTYPRRWGLGPVAMQKKKLIKEGKLGKFGEKIEGETPKAWSADYIDYKSEVCVVLDVSRGCCIDRNAISIATHCGPLNPDSGGVHNTLNHGSPP